MTHLATNTHSLTMVCAHTHRRAHTHGKTNNTSPLVLYVVKSMDVDVIGDIHGVCCSAEAVQTSHCILDRFFFFFRYHKIIVLTVI